MAKMKVVKGKKSLNTNWIIHQLAFEKKLNEQFIGNNKILSEVASIMSTQVMRLKVPNETTAPRCLIVGPTSSGKTYLSDLITKNIIQPRVNINMSMVTPEGYKGTNLSEGFQRLIDDGGINGLDRAQKGSVVVLDEIDKAIRRSSADEWISQLTYNTLPTLGGEEIQFYDSEEATTLKINTKNMLILMMGVFPEIPVRSWSTYQSACRALIKYGFCDEWVSRITHIFYLKPLSRKEVIQVLKAEAERLGPLYQLWDGEVPEISTRKLSIIADRVLQKPHSLGVRHGKMHIHKALFEYAYKNGVSSMH